MSDPDIALAEDTGATDADTDSNRLKKFGIVAFVLLFLISCITLIAVLFIFKSDNQTAQAIAALTSAVKQANGDAVKTITAGFSEAANKTVKAIEAQTSAVIGKNDKAIDAAKEIVNAIDAQTSTVNQVIGDIAKAIIFKEAKAVKQAKTPDHTAQKAKPATRPAHVHGATDAHRGVIPPTRSTTATASPIICIYRKELSLAAGTKSEKITVPPTHYVIYWDQKKVAKIEIEFGDETQKPITGGEYHDFGVGGRGRFRLLAPKNVKVIILAR